MAAPTAETRRVRQREATRRAILDASEELLVQEGYESFSMRRLADRCGFSAPTIYHHFGDKPRLIEALLEERFGLLLVELARVERSGDPTQALCALARAFVEFGLRHPTHYRLLSSERPPGVEPPESAERAQELLEGPLHELERAGRLRCQDIEPVVQSVWALLHGFVSLQGIYPDHPWSKDLVEVGLDCMLHGMLDRKSAGRGVAR